ncbi:MAG: hypothetical protein V7636_1402, partial [Actinomycetota bacterium]
TLDVEVIQHDDGSVDSMHDLDIRHRDGRVAAVEVTADVDPEATVLWNLMNGGGRWVEPELAGGWMVELELRARAKRIRSELPGLLRQLEKGGVSEVSIRRSRSSSDERVEHASSLGIRRLHQSGTDFPGIIYVTLNLPLERSGGFVADDSDALARWVGGFLAVERPDVCTKLAISDRDERHAFVLVSGFSTATFAVTDVLFRVDSPLPSLDPALPEGITDVWIVSTWVAGRGFRWSCSSGWSHFDKQAPTEVRAG